MPRLTIGMATYGDFDGVYFTLQALRMYHDLTDVELIVVDNKGDKRLKDWITYWGKGLIKYRLYTDVIGTTMPREMVFRFARGEYVICLDSHVLLYPGAIDRLWDGDALVHGPMMYDDNRTCVTEMKDEWRANMWGIWGDAKDRNSLPTEPFEIWGHGLGLFGCKKEFWPGFNPEFRGFGGEEGYIHEKFRQAGRQVLCLPWMKWMHKFNHGVRYPLDVKDRIRNYIAGSEELGTNPYPIYEHFGINLVNDVTEQGVVNR